MPQTALVSRPGVETARWFAHRALPLGIGNRGGNGYCHSVRNLVLHREDIGEIAVVALGPDMLAGLGLDQLRGDPDTIAGFAQAACEHITHAQLAADLFHVDRSAFVSE